MHISCRGIILDKNTVILIHRKKNIGKSFREYYVIPGGKKEKNETDYETLIREIKEEVGIRIKPKNKILEYNSKYDNSIQKIYLCDYLDGKINTGKGPEFKNLQKDEIFLIEKISIDELKKVKLVPEEIEAGLKKLIITLIIQEGSQDDE